jgi:hypothetical protein
MPDKEKLKPWASGARKILDAGPTILLIGLIILHGKEAPFSGALVDYLQRQYDPSADTFTPLLESMKRLAEAWPISDFILQFERLGAVLIVLYAGRFLVIGYAVLYAMVIAWDEWLSRDPEVRRILEAAGSGQPQPSKAARAKQYGCFTGLFAAIIGAFALIYVWIASPELCVGSGALQFSCAPLILTLLALCVIAGVAIDLVWVFLERRFCSLSEAGKIWKTFD